MAKQINRTVNIDNIEIIKDIKMWSRRDSLLLPALSQAEYFKLDDSSMSDIVVLTKNLVKYIKYYDSIDNKINTNNETNNWSGFLQNIQFQKDFKHKLSAEDSKLIDKFEKNELSKNELKTLSQKLGPHEVLFFAFLSLLNYPREQINNFSRRYLDYYYRDYLELSQKPSIPAKAHVIFELKNNDLDVLLEKGTLLNAGEDSNRKRVFYALEKDLVVTSTQLTSIQTLSSIYEDGRGLVQTIIFDKDKDKIYNPKPFKTFGELEGSQEEIGFSINSHILLDASSKVIILNIRLNTVGDIRNLKDIFTFYISGKKDWIKLQLKQEEGNPSINDKTLIFKFDLTENIAYPKEYDAKIYFDNNYPILKTVLNDLKSYKELKNLKIENISLTIQDGLITGKAKIPENSINFKHVGPWITQHEINSFLLPTYSDFGYLFLGIAVLQPDNPLTILWQMGKGRRSDNAKVNWQYWSDINQWENFIDIEDDTGNLSGSGIITFQIPKNISNKHPIMSDNQYWLRAVLKQDSNFDVTTVPDTLDIKLNAGVATFSKQNQTKEDFSVLKSETIKNLVQDNPSIKKVTQPYIGFDGKNAESEEEFLIRSSMRLKHKNRAITACDYEKLILTEFPRVYMVKATSSNECRVVIELIVDADVNTFLDRPKAPEQLLDKIKKYFQMYKPPYVELDVKNVELEKKNLQVKVCFIEGNQALYEEKLERDIRWFLSPWGSSNFIDQDNNINQPEIINFIKTRDYIKQIESLKIIESLKMKNNQQRRGKNKND